MTFSPATLDAVVMTLGASADEASTHYALARCAGCTELGPPTALRLPLKAIVVAGSTLACHELRKANHPRWAKALRWGIFTGYLLVATHNLRTSQ